ncbi:hypothetical protein LX64_00001 [Chitinophaga skermanii]|uniref:Uncharacterized protein n=1 Tax=Chitinophaga skermanii TaxID=331697 RepID=A0A327R0L8_9BACT|nr:hypothetical protein [Chitinophaga skermanii]RAJ10399.1 hypothetical protein LX64_00001 [Chitinophaga skermanii]
MRYLLFFSVLIMMAACNSKPTPQAPPTDTTILLPDGDTTTRPAMQIPDSLVVRVDTSGVFIGDLQVHSNAELGSKLLDTLNDMYQTMHQLPKGIALLFSDQILMGVRGNVHDAVKDAQNNMLSIVADQQFHTSMKKLQQAQKDSLMQQFPILYQKH